MGSTSNNSKDKEYVCEARFVLKAGMFLSKLSKLKHFDVMDRINGSEELKK